MKLLTCWLLFSTICFAITLSPGGQIHITQAAINRAVHSLLQQSIVRNKTFNIPDFREGKFKFFDLSANVKIEPQNANIQLRENGEIVIHVWDVEVEGRGKGRFHWGFIKKGANLRVKTEDLYLKIILSIENENGRPRIINKKTYFHTGKLHLYATGGFIERIIEKVLDLFKEKIERAIDDGVISFLNEKIQKFSDCLVKIDMKKSLKGRFSNISIDYGLTSNPTVVNSTLTVQVATQFWYNGHENEALIPSSGPYPFGAPWQMVCIDLDTNLVFGTAAHAYKLRNGPSIKKTLNLLLSRRFKNDLLNETIGCDCDDYFCPVNFIAEFSDFCFKDSDATVEFINEGREIHFNNSGVFISLSGKGSVDILSKNQTTRMMDFEVDAVAHLMQNLTIDDWTARGTAVISKSKFSAHSPLLGPMDATALDDIWESTLKEHIKKWIDELAEPGIPLPALKFANFYNTRVGFNGPFVRLCSDVDIKFENLLS